MVLVIGGANLDRLARSSAPLRLGTSNPGEVTETPGGVGRNVAENLARLGTATRLVLAVGDDPAGARVLAATWAAGVETIEVPWPGATGTYTALLDHDGSLVAGVADMAATASIGAAHLQPHWVEDASWLVLDGNLGLETVLEAARLADSAAVPVVLDPVSAPKAAALGPALGDVAVHTITPTTDELEALTGVEDPDRAAALLHERGVAVVWLRRGEAGSVVYRRDHPPVTVALPAVRAVDVTGAGDAMLAAYVDALGQGSELLAAAWAGAAAAALTVVVPTTVRPDLSRDMIGALIRGTVEEQR